jgi:hypothetical protein
MIPTEGKGQNERQERAFWVGAKLLALRVRVRDRIWISTQGD